MPRPQLTFFTELESEPLCELFETPGVIEFLTDGGHHVGMGMLDLSARRAEVIRRLEAAGIRVTAWLLLDEADGYWTNADNAPAAMERYAALHAYSRRERLKLPRLGLDIEPPRSQLDQLVRRGDPAVFESFRHRRTRAQIESAEAAYRRLVELAHRDGRTVETYHYPQILDERRAGSHLLRRCFGLVEIDADIEVLMLYRSYLGLEGCRVYYGEAQAIAVGVTGGGVFADDDDVEPKLSWDELRDDLLAASRASSTVNVFSLEGCVARGMLQPLAELRWEDEPAPLDPAAMRRARRDRRMHSLLARSERMWDLVSPSRRTEEPPR